MIFDEELTHYGTLRKSGRYPWGSGSTQSARNKMFLDTVEDLKRQGMTETEIAAGFSTPSHKMTTTQLRALKSIALNEQKADQIRRAQRMKAHGMSNVAIGQNMGINESSVRSLLEPGRQEKANRIQATADMLRKEVDEKGLIDVGTGVERDLALTRDRLDTSIAVLREEGYGLHHVKVSQLGTKNETTVKVLSKPGTHTRDVYAGGLDKIQSITEYTPDRGSTWIPLRKPTSVSSKKLDIKYAEDGGTDADGVIYIRPGTKNLDLGKSRYAQVRIAVDGTHYLKGMAVYKDDLPDGVDLQFNTNKKNTGNKHDALKPMQRDENGVIDTLNPFGATIKNGGQRGHLNIVNEEGDWDKWSKGFSSQFLSKQSPTLAKTQLELTQEKRKTDLDEIMSLTNPTVKKKLLESFADDVDSAAVHLKSAALPRTSNHVLLPVKSVKVNEIYAPNHNNGDRVALVRHPHGGTFEIPELTVNNRNKEAQKLFGTDAKDAVGINPKVAERLSGADFDGDTVLVIPNPKGAVKSTPALESLKGFDPQSYKLQPGSTTKRLKGASTQNEMGQISNLITDMTIKGASQEHLARAVRHSMVVIDAEKHGLDHKASARDHGIAALKEKYQDGGASTLISRTTSDTRVNERKLRSAKDGGPVDRETGKKVYVETGASYTKVDSKGREIVVVRTDEVKRGALTDDARTLVSSNGGTRVEHVYADHANRLKGMANTARKEAVNTQSIPYSRSAKQAYHNDVVMINAKLNVALKNAPRERQAQLLANAIVDAKRQANPNMDASDLKKIKTQALNETRMRTGAGKTRIKLEQSEWDAIQAGAISTHKLEQVLSNSDLDTVRKLATPRTTRSITPTAKARATAMLANGATQAEVAAQLGVPISTLMSSISEE